MTDLLSALQNPNVAAFLRVIRQGETSQDDDKAYRTMFGGGLFDSFADHPRQAITRGSLTSTAAGAYQFLSRTWDGLVRQYGFPDFSPPSQDQGAVALIAGRGALQDVLEGRLDAAIRKCSKEWASLPGSPYGQPTVSLATCREVFAAFGGVESDGRATGNATQLPPSAPQTQREVTMAPLIPILIESLVPMIPQLAKLFGSGSEVSTRNNAALEVVADQIVKATNAVNLQDAVSKAQADPAALDAVRQAVSDALFTIGEAGGGGIDGARKAASSADQPPLPKQGAFWISLVLLVMPFLLLGDVFYGHPDNYDGNLRTQIVTGVMLVISMVGAFWLGSSFGSQKKDFLNK